MAKYEVGDTLYEKVSGGFHSGCPIVEHKRVNDQDYYKTEFSIFLSEEQIEAQYLTEDEVDSVTEAKVYVITDSVNNPKAVYTTKSGAKAASALYPRSHIRELVVNPLDAASGDKIYAVRRNRDGEVVGVTQSVSINDLEGTGVEETITAQSVAEAAEKARS
jgi:hypothetical protein